MGSMPSQSSGFKGCCHLMATRNSRSAIAAMILPTAVATSGISRLRGSMTRIRLFLGTAAASQLVRALPPFNALLRFLGLLITLSLLAVASIQAAETPVATQPMSVVVGARVTTTPERARLILDLSQPTKFAVVSLDAPNRIAVDVQAGALKFDAPLPPAGAGLVSAYSVTMADAGRARTVLTLAGPAQVQQAYVLNAFADQPARLVVDLIPDTAENFAKRVAIDAAAMPGQAPAPMTDNSTPPGASEANPAPAGAAQAQVAANAAAAAARTAETASAPSVPAPGAPAVASNAPMAASAPQVAPPAATPAAMSAKPLIVLDPGHGGIDSGARANGVMEKDIVLAFALKLQARLVKSGRFDVALTRSDDAYLA